MQALAGKGLHGLPQDEEDLKKLTPAEREELILKIRTSLQVKILKIRTSLQVKMYLFFTARCSVFIVDSICVLQKKAAKTTTNEHHPKFLRELDPSDGMEEEEEEGRWSSSSLQPVHIQKRHVIL